MDKPSKPLTPPEKWDGLFAQGAAYKPLNVLLARKMVKRAEEVTGKSPVTALDLGCGTGGDLATLKSVRLEAVSGVDCSKVALAEAEKAAPGSPLHLHDLNDPGLPVSGRIFDFILCKLTVAFIKDKESFLKMVSDLMGDSSVFVVMTPVLHEGIEYSKEDKPGIAVRYEEFRKQLEGVFSRVEDLHHDYNGQRGDTVTFLATK